MSKKTYKQFTEEQSDCVELDESISLTLRKAKGRMMKKINKLSKTKFIKKLNAAKPLTMVKALPKAAKKVRKFIMQKLVGKGKDLKDLAIAQKARLEDLTTKKMKTMGARVAAMTKRFAKGVIKAHKDRQIAHKEKDAHGEIEKVAKVAKKAGVPHKEIEKHVDKHKAIVSKHADKHAEKGSESETDAETGKGKKPDHDVSKKDDEKSDDKKSGFKGFMKKMFGKKDK